MTDRESSGTSLPLGSTLLAMELQFSDVPVGGLLAFAGEAKAEQLLSIGWLVANGQEVAIEEYPELFSVLGTTFGSSGSRTFRLPAVPPMKLVNADHDEFDAPYLIRFTSQRQLGSATADA